MHSFTKIYVFLVSEEKNYIFRCSKLCSYNFFLKIYFKKTLYEKIWFTLFWVFSIYRFERNSLFSRLSKCECLLMKIVSNHFSVSCFHAQFSFSFSIMLFQKFQINYYSFVFYSQWKIQKNDSICKSCESNLSLSFIFNERKFIILSNQQQ